MSNADRIQRMIDKGLRGSDAHARQALLEMQRALAGGAVPTESRTEPRSPRANPFGARKHLTPARAAIVQSFLAPTRILTVRNQVALPPGGGPASTSPGLPIQFQGGAGWVWGWRGSIVAPLAAAGSFQEAMSSMFVEFNINGRSDKVTDGRVVSRASFETLFGAINGVPFAPLRLYVNQRDQINFTFENRHPVNTYTPDMTLFFIDDPHMELADLLWCDPDEIATAPGAGVTR